MKPARLCQATSIDLIKPSPLRELLLIFPVLCPRLTAVLAASAVFFVQHVLVGFLDAGAYYKRRDKTAIFGTFQAIHAFRMTRKQE
jgi:hypothetical protein